MSGTIDDASETEPRKPGRRVAFLVLALECDRPVVRSARYSLDRVTQITLGRGAAREATRRDDATGRTLDVHVPSAAMSTEHARLVRAHGEWVVEDRGSRNGTFVNGVRVTRAFVGPGDVLALGRTLFLVTPPILTSEGAGEDIDLATAPPLVGHVSLDPTLDALLGEARRIARSGLSILIRGETGTGKDVLARSLHDHSGRSGELVAVNCGGIPAPLVEAHFFGHVKGSFSGAVRNELGVFRAADGGTLFLDEVGDLLPASQAALLRALQEREVVPVGATRAIKVDLRVLSATHRPIENMAGRGEFRSDLLARLVGFTLELPPLRARRLDLGVIVGALLARNGPEKAAGVRFTQAAAESLFRYHWPHNTRELEQCLSRALVLAGDEPIDVAHLPPSLSGGASALAARSGLAERDERIRRELLEQLARHRGNLANVGRAMGRARMQVHRWCLRFGIDPNVYRE